MFRFQLTGLAAALLVRCVAAQQIINGQIFTPGIAIVDSPQPNTPEGGDFIQVALDVTSDGQLQLPPYPSDPVSAIYNITMFLSSYTTGKNFTITNGTAPPWDTTLGDIMQQEKGSTVKHVNWVWPDCLVGNGPPTDANSARGAYNISIRQNFRLNNSDMYTIFDLPIKVINQIPFSSDKYGFRPSCDSLNNPLLSQVELAQSANQFTRIPGTAIETGGKGGSGNNGGASADGSGLGGTKPNAGPGDGLGNAASSMDWRSGAHWIWVGTLVAAFVL